VATGSPEGSCVDVEDSVVPVDKVVEMGVVGTSEPAGDPSPGTGVETGASEPPEHPTRPATIHHRRPRLKG
jgi:hypothetical protein